MRFGKIARVRWSSCGLTHTATSRANSNPPSSKAALDLSIEDGRRRMQTHALFQRGEAVGPERAADSGAPVAHS